MANTKFNGPVTSTNGFIGAVTGNITGNITGNVTGDLTGDVTGNVTGDVTGDLTGDVTGNVTGNLTGNVTGFVSGGITSGATAAEINLNSDVSAFTETLTAAGAITFSTTCRVHKFDTTLGAQTNTIPAPAANQVGQLKIIEMTVRGGTNDTVITLTNVDGGSAGSTATFDSVGDTLVMVGGVSKWHIVKEIGVTMA